ncbi:protein ROS1A-like [Apium graveolens]|uniref:protein ROS1A-like n=1 Tax=Apium graveolens TaxID=4045 RepID=UPI003D7A4C88
MFVTLSPESVSEIKISHETDPNPSETIASNLTCQAQNCEPIIKVPESPRLEYSVEQPDLRAPPEKLKTVHQVFELPDSHPLLEEFQERVPDDPCPYLLAVWPTESFQQQSSGGDSMEPGMCNVINIHPSCRTNVEETVKGTILIPRQTATRGHFPVHGSYFQINEVFADHESSELPINVPKAWVCNLPKRSLHCGTTAISIYRGTAPEEIQHCSSRGYICVRGFDRRQRVVKRLNARFPVSPRATRNVEGAAL